MPKVRKNKSKDNVVPFNKSKVDKVAEEKSELRQSEQDRLNAVIKEKCSEILEIIDTSQIEKVIDTLDLARNKFPGSGNSLDALCKRFRVERSEVRKEGDL